MTGVHTYCSEAGFDYHEQPLSNRPPSLKPLDFGEPSLFGRSYSSPRQMSSRSVIKRMTIEFPAGFRHLDHVEGQRRSLIPLQLDPVILRHSYTAHSGQREGMTETQHLPESQKLQSRRSDMSAYMSPVLLDRLPHTSNERHQRRLLLSSHSSSSSIRSMRRQAALETRSSSTSVPQSLDWNRFSRRRNSNRISSCEITGSGVDQEILELNTIVEEIRSGSTKSKSSEGHVSAVAPLMSIRARSETLQDIGSAFIYSRESQNPDEPVDDACSDCEAQRAPPMENRLSRPFTAMPDLGAVLPDTEPSKSRSDLRIGKC